MAKNKYFDEVKFHSHFPNDISDEIQDYITNCIMDWSRYLFTHREGRQQWAYCTHCEKEHPTEVTLIHGKIAECPHCKTAATVKASGRGRKNMIDQAYLVWYEKSVINPQILIARGIYAVRDYSKDYRKTKTELKNIARYVFEQGVGGQMMVRGHYISESAWWSYKSVCSEAVHSMSYVNSYYAKHSIEEAVKRTPFQYCQWEEYDLHDRVKVFDLAAKYPCMEYLTKLGMAPVIRAKLTGQATFGAINWHGKSIDKVLRLSKAEAKEWVKQPFKSGLLSLRAYQFFNKKLNLGFTFDQSHQLSSLAEMSSFHDVIALLTYSPIKTTLQYILKQINRPKSNHYKGYTARTVLSDWSDYIKECEELGMNLQQEQILFPNDLHEAHQKNMAKVKIKRDELVAVKVSARSAQLEKFRFEYGGFIVRPAASSEELFAEGKALSHCVGRYAADYGEGKTDLFVVREVSDPDKPYFTLEIKKGILQQCRGYKNCSMTPEVKAFVDRFLNAMKGKSKTVERQDIAV